MQIFASSSELKEIKLISHNGVFFIQQTSIPVKLKEVNSQDGKDYKTQIKKYEENMVELYKCGSKTFFFFN